LNFELSSTWIFWGFSMFFHFTFFSYGDSFSFITFFPLLVKIFSDDLGLYYYVHLLPFVNMIGAVHKVRHARGGRGSERVWQFV